MNITPILATDAPANAWSVFTTLLWFGLLALGFCLFREQITDILTHLARRLRSGAAVKLGTIELGALRTADKPLDSRISTPQDSEVSAARQTERDGLYKSARGVMLVHQLYRSNEAGQQYDILIYIIPHRNSSLIQVTHVEYFLGAHGWGNRIFRCTDRAHGFSLLTAAYGPFLCMAHVYFNDGSFHSMSRYIDFEMGASAPFLEHDDA
jgi:hypothetical protein